MTKPSKRSQTTRRAGGNGKLSGKQLRYLFATGFVSASGSGSNRHLKVEGDISSVSGPARTLARYLSGDKSAYKSSSSSVATDKSAAQAKKSVSASAKSKNSDTVVAAAAQVKKPAAQVKKPTKSDEPAAAPAGSKKITPETLFENTGFGKPPHTLTIGGVAYKSTSNGTYNDPSNNNLYLSEINNKLKATGAGVYSAADAHVQASSTRATSTQGQIDTQNAVKKLAALSKPDAQANAYAAIATDTQRLLADSKIYKSTLPTSTETMDDQLTFNSNLTRPHVVSFSDGVKAYYDSSSDQYLLNGKLVGNSALVDRASQSGVKATITAVYNGQSSQDAVADQKYAKSQAVSKISAAVRPADNLTPSDADYAKPKGFSSREASDAWARENLGQWKDSVAGPDQLLPMSTARGTQIHDALDNYTGQSFAIINEHLRGAKPGSALTKNSTTAASQVKLIDEAFSKYAVATPQALTLHRGVLYEYAASLQTQIKAGTLKVGSSISDKGYQSTAMEASETFDAGAAGFETASVRMRITVPKGRKVLPMGSGFQSEVLLNRNAQYQVTRIDLSDPAGPVLHVNLK